MTRVAASNKPASKRGKSRSTAQMAAELHMITKFGEEISVALRKKKVKIEECSVEIDGFGRDGDGTIHMVEAWAHISHGGSVGTHWQSNWITAQEDFDGRLETRFYGRLPSTA